MLFAWQMLMPYMSMAEMLLLFCLNGSCYCHFVLMADVVAIFYCFGRFFFYVSVYCNYNTGWCYCHVADGKATCLVLYLCDGWCYCPVADGIATEGCELPWLMLFPGGRWQGNIHFNLSSEVLCRTSSHIWGRWYLPMFLFRDGLFTLIYNASLSICRGSGLPSLQC